MSGTVVVLNGAAGAGKTSIARALQALMREPYLNAGIDRFLELLPARYLKPPLWQDVLGLFDRPGTTGARLIGGMHRAIAALAESGNSVVADHVMVDRRWVGECADLFAPLPAYFVGLLCPLDVLERRERERRDRQATPGEVAQQFQLVHACAAYDLQLDTSVVSPAQAAALVCDLVDAGPPRAFRLLALFDGAPRFVGRVLAATATNSWAALLDEAEALAWSMTDQEQVELLDAHPRIGAAPPSVSAASYREQGYDRASALDGDLQVELDRLNAAYEARFGFRFVIFVAGRPRSEIVPIIRQRLAADRDAEKQRALRDVFAIARDRARRLGLQPSDGVA